MGKIEVEWDDQEKTIIRWDFYGLWTWDDWDVATREGNRMRAEAADDPIIPTIFNLKLSGKIPPNVLPHARSALETMQDHEYVILAHGSGYARTILEIFVSLNPSAGGKILVADSVADARKLIAERRLKDESS